MSDSESSPPDTHGLYDCAIIGGGPAGLTCSIFLGRFRRKVVVIDSGRPRNYASRGIHGFLGFHAIEPAELLKRGREEARSVGVDLCGGEVAEVERDGDVFVLRGDFGTVRARRLVLAYGVRDELPAIDGIESYYGSSAFHCPDCDGFEVRDRPIAVVGWGVRVAGFALKLLQYSDDLTIFTLGHELGISPEERSKLEAEEIRIVTTPVKRLLGANGVLEAIELEKGEKIEATALFFTVGIKPSSDLAERLGCRFVEGKPDCVVDERMETSVPRVYAIGDLVPGPQLAIAAAADGAVAAIAVNQSLLPPSRRVS